MLDAVFNHVSDKFAPFCDVLKHGKHSPYFNWFIVEGDYVNKSRTNYCCFAECRYMPKLNTANRELQRYLIDVATYWIKNFDIDGWRLDVSDEVSHGFWRELRKAVKQLKPDAVLIGENWHNSESFLQGDQFDSIMNYAFTKQMMDFLVQKSTDEKLLRKTHRFAYEVHRHDKQHDVQLVGLPRHTQILFPHGVRQRAVFVRFGNLCVYARQLQPVLR